jgi:4-amino-4-deoxy-L-arabinose transferase-like glycosyltransferase
METTSGLLRPPPPAVRDARRHLTWSWSRVALPTLLALTALAYVWDLSSSGYANSFYAAAVQAGTKSWKAFFFGSIDSSSFITVDKPPASLWVMALSGRIFGFSSASMLIPQALEGVAAVWLLFCGVRRWFGTGAGFAAGALMAVTPVAALMFRFNNPDALLVLLMVAGAYCLVRALEGGATRWVLAAGTMIGFAFLAKMAQAFLVLPAFALVYMVAAPVGLRRRAWQMALGGVAIVVSAGWWVAIVAVWPAGSRPMIDGSPDNSILNLITGYNGLGRIFGSSGPGGGGGGGGANFSGSTGVLRLFNNLMGGQASWLLPAALLALAAGLWARRRAPRTDRVRAALLLWGGWLVVSGIVFSLGSGVIHTYYTVALAPAIAALVAIGGWMAWTGRDSRRVQAIAIVAVALATGWAWALLDRTPSWEPWLRTLVLVAGAAAVLTLVACMMWRRLALRLLVPAVVLGMLASLAGPVAYSASTITTGHTGSTPTAGPSTGGGFGMGGGGSSGAGGRSAGGGGSVGGGQTSASTALDRALSVNAGRYKWVAATSGSQSAASLELATGGEPVMAIGGFSNQGGNLTLQKFKEYVARGEIHYYIASSGGMGGGRAFSAGGRTFSPPSGSASTGRPSGQPAAGGGTRSGGGAPGGGTRSGGGAPGGGTRNGGGAPGGMSTSNSAITTWVKAHFKKVTIGGQTMYDLTQRVS